jgi:hypothetical protein
MSDALDRLAGEAAPLLSRVDATLAGAGAPPDHPVWPLLRRVRGLPSDAVAAVASWRPEPLAQSTTPLRTLARRYAEVFDPLPAAAGWDGTAAEMFRLRLAALRSYVQGPGTDSLAGRLRATATYLDELGGWMTRSRRAVAAALADVLPSAEAVTLLTSTTPAGPAAALAGPAASPAGVAAARIAAHVLHPVATACEEARRLHDDWLPRLGQLVHQPPRDPAPTGGREIRIGE